MTGAVPHIAGSDCERCRPGLIAQPANTASSLAYVLAGASVLRAEGARPEPRRTELALGWATIAAGIGSVAYHGPGTALGRYVHDAGLLATLGFVALADAEVTRRRPASTAALVAVPVAAAVAALPKVSPGAQLLAGAAATAGEAARMAGADGGGRPGHRRAEVALATAGAVAHLLGRTGGPWCRPDAWLQPHAFWHVATAGVTWLRHRDRAATLDAAATSGAPRRASPVRATTRSSRRATPVP